MDSLKKRQLQFLENEVRRDEAAARVSAAKAAAAAEAASSAQSTGPPGAVAAVAGAALPADEESVAAMVSKRKVYIRAVDILKQHKKPLPGADLLSRLALVPGSAPAKTLLASLRSNASISLSSQGTAFQYLPPHSHVRNIDQLYGLVKDTPSGFISSELKDAYPTVLQDLDKLHRQRKVLLVPQTEKNKFNAFIVFPAPDDSTVEVAPEILRMWQETTWKRGYGELEQEMRHMGVPITKQDRPPPRATKKARKARKQRQSKIHNVHLDRSEIDLTRDYTALDATRSLRKKEQEEADQQSKNRVDL